MDALEQMYQQIILDHSRRRSGSGTVKDVQAQSYQVNPTCGDEVTLGVTVKDDKIVKLVWEGDGCSISQASLSILDQLVDGEDLDMVAARYQAMEQMMHSRGAGVPDNVLDLLEDGASLEGTSQFPNRIKCALLGWYALRDALAHTGVDIAERNTAHD